MSTSGGIVLCGGQSKRMGFAKALLPFGPETMLERIVRLLREVVDPIVVIAAPRQELPTLWSEVRVLRDRREGFGPLEGIAVGLTTLELLQVESAYVTGCDTPLLRADFVRRMIELADGYPIAVPRVAAYEHCLAGVYSCRVLADVERLLAENCLRLGDLYRHVATRFVEEEALREADPDLSSLRNVNEPADYFDALSASRFAASPEIMAALGR